MNTVVTSLANYQPSHSSAFQSVLSPEVVARASPRCLCAGGPRANKCRPTPSSRVSGCSPPWVRPGSCPLRPGRRLGRRVPVHARHLIRLRRRYETIQLRDAIPGDPVPQLARRDQCLPAAGRPLSRRRAPMGSWCPLASSRSGGSCTGAMWSRTSCERPFGSASGSIRWRRPSSAWSALRSIACSSSTSRSRHSRCAFPRPTEPPSSPPGSWYLGGRKTSAMTSGARSTCFRRTSSEAGFSGARRPIG